MAKLLAEIVYHDDIEILEEEDKQLNIKKLKIKAPFLISETKNKNGRIYPKSIIEREVNKFNENKIKRRLAFGQLDHPMSSTVQGKEVAIHIDELYMDGKDAVGIASILNTPNGDIVRNVLKDGYAWGLSSRGLGTLDGSNKVKSDYYYITEDVVTDPSAYQAWADKILESKEFIMENDGNIVEVAINNLQKKVNKKYNSDVIRLYMEEFLREIKNKL